MLSKDVHYTTLFHSINFFDSNSIVREKSRPSPARRISIIENVKAEMEGPSLKHGNTKRKYIYKFNTDKRSRNAIVKSHGKNGPRIWENNFSVRSRCVCISFRSMGRNETAMFPYRFLRISQIGAVLRNVRMKKPRTGTESRFR